MTDSASPCRSEYPMDPKLWRQPAFVTQFWQPSGAGIHLHFYKTEKIKFFKGGKV